jgi:hypothetical protein
VTVVATSAPDAKRIDRLREMYADEVNGGALFRGLAKYADEPRRDVFLSLAAAEERHAAHWARLLREAGVEPRTPRFACARCVSSPATSGRRRYCP